MLWGEQGWLGFESQHPRCNWIAFDASMPSVEYLVLILALFSLKCLSVGVH